MVGWRSREASAHPRGQQSNASDPEPAAGTSPHRASVTPALDDPTPDYMNLLGMIFSMCGLMLKVGRAGVMISGEKSELL